MKKTGKRNMALVLALLIGGMGCYSMGNISAAAGFERTEDAVLSKDSSDKGEQEAAVDGTSGSGDSEAAIQDRYRSVSDNEAPGEQEGISGDDGSDGSVQEETSDDGSSDGATEGESGVADEGGSAEQENMGETTGAEKEKGDTVSSGDQKEKSHQGLEKANFGNSNEVLGLIVPEKMTLILDPWEIEGRGQVYSEQYVFKNTGTTAGRLTLYDLACVPQAQSGGTVRAQREEINEDDSKAIYVELVLSNGDAVTFLEDGSGRYEIELEAGDELAVYFDGEININNTAAWENGELKVTLSYVWDTGEEQPSTKMNAGNGEGIGDVSGGDAVPDGKTESGGEGSTGSADNGTSGLDAEKETKPEGEAGNEGGTKGTAGADGGDI